MKRWWLGLGLFLVCCGYPWAQTVETAPLDPISELIVKAEQPVQTPLQFIQRLEALGWTISYHAVANRGACNPARGSYSVFATATGPFQGRQVADWELTFGVFVEPDPEGSLALQNDFHTRLLVEVIARDARSHDKNFWELIGEKDHATWYFRGTSKDIRADVADLNLSPQAGTFGTRLRCSGCHTSGDLVMKEHFPYNDWRRGEPLKLGPWSDRPARNPVEDFAHRWLREASPANHLDDAVERSLRDYVANLEGAGDSDRAWFRSLLAPLEMNLICDKDTFARRIDLKEAIQIPAAFFVDPRLSGNELPVTVPIAVYRQALKELGSSFAAEETPGLVETEHAFLVPVRSRVDELKIDNLMRRGLLDQELLSDLLAVDMETPIYSPRRLELMALIPESVGSAQALRNHLLAQVGEADEPADARSELSLNLRHSERNAAFHRKRARAILAECRRRVVRVEYVKDWLRLAAQRRVEILAAQTAQNPRGNILEGGLGADGFRRIFPNYQNWQPKAYQYRLDGTTGRLTPPVED